MITDANWLRILSGMGVRPFTAAKWMSPFSDEVQLDKFSAGEADLMDWLPQILYESAMLECMEERLTYNPERICAVWPRRFPTLASAIPYSMNPVKLANTVYANRMGNGDYDSGDGYRYRGRCPIELTGLDAYLHLGNIMGQDLDVNPDLLVQPHFGLQAALLWWEDAIPDSMLSDQVQLRRRVQGGLLGLDRVTALREKLGELIA